MPSFFTLNLALGALRANQYALSTTAHNIANSGTEGYHRQEAVFLAGSASKQKAATTGVGVPLLGTGVIVQTIRRAQTDQIDDQVRISNQAKGQWSYRKDALAQVEALLSEPSDLGLSAAIDAFWNSWEDLAASPESQPARVAIVQGGVALAQRITTLYTDFRNTQEIADRCIVDNAGQINTIARNIAQLNERILRCPDENSVPNDLLDQRDMLLDQLSAITKFELSGGRGGGMMISIGGKNLVQGSLTSEVEITEGPHGWSRISWADNGSEVLTSGGEISGQIRIRDETIEGYIESLNRLAETIVNRVNELHSTGLLDDGSPAGNFFTPGTDASNMTVDASLISDTSKVASSTTGKSGGNDLATAISAIRYERLIGNQTINDAYTQIVGQIGADTRDADSRGKSAELSMQQLRRQRDAIAGVSIDEEMANMVRFQQSYNAAARIFNVIDEMIDQIVNRLGTSGR